MLSEEQVKRTRINLSRRGWRSEEPLDKQLVPEQPQMLRSCIELLVEEGEKTREQIVQELRMNPLDIEELACIPRGYFSGVMVMEKPDIKLKESKKPERSVIQFPTK